MLFLMWTAIMLVELTEFGFRLIVTGLEVPMQVSIQQCESIRRIKLFVDLTNKMVVHNMSYKISCFNEFVFKV